MGGWPDRLLKIDGLAVGRRTADASGGKSVALPTAKNRRHCAGAWK
jgi:hypothetical protein